ncbi:MAG TPA: hypothetical protein VEW28_07165 [Candidatus Kapabacteria bacterium]|nr:hypothetical protein [Candidatus Kapabacteria bacterium]
MSRKSRAIQRAKENNASEHKASVVPEEMSYDEQYERYYQIVKRRFNVAPGEITVYCGANVRTNTEAAYRKAIELVDAKAFQKALVINTSSRQRWALQLGREVSPDGRIGDKGECDVRVAASSEGLLSRELYDFKHTVESSGIDLVIINSWEFASCDCRRREELLFRLRSFMFELNVTVIVYSQAAVKEYVPGKIMRGTLGRLAGLADIIAPVTTDVIGLSSDVKENVREEKSEHFISEEGHLNGKAPVRILEEEREPLVASDNVENYEEQYAESDEGVLEMV